MGVLDATDDARLRLAPPPQPLPAGEGTKMWPAPPTPPRWGRDKNVAGTPDPSPLGTGQEGGRPNSVPVGRSDEWRLA